MSELRRLPSVDKLLKEPRLQELTEMYGHTRVVNVIREVEEIVRVEILTDGGKVDEKALFDRIIERISVQPSDSPRKVINATGVILHTNLGRAPLAKEALSAIDHVSGGYSNLEYDLEHGTRGSRNIHAHDLLCQLTGAEDALVVNNNAGAVLLALSALAARKKVVISRSQLVEIGGGFRVPDVMKQSGAKLVEVGTTNRSRLSDYQTPLEEGAALVLRAHSSNFKMIGFTVTPLLKQIIDLTHQFGVPFMDDLGSGALLDTSRFGLGHEPMVQESIQAGADIVCFSGDKLLGGPQAGIIVGQRQFLEKIKRHPLARAVRADKLCLAGLTATLQIYMDGQAEVKIPIWKMISAKPEELRDRVERWINYLGVGEVVTTMSTVGGGSLPGEEIPTFALGIKRRGLTNLISTLRQASCPIIARIEEERAVFDPRTILLEEESDFLKILHEILLRSER